MSPGQQAALNSATLEHRMALDGVRSQLEQVAAGHLHLPAEACFICTADNVAGEHNQRGAAANQAAQQVFSNLPQQQQHAAAAAAASAQLQQRLPHQPPAPGWGRPYRHD
mmetsp:Transcript_2411/g.5404  ORF Transcript_2411/g.5404 Transcript_2411/m.5404 type:complete len:110 (-) Transcript_2411:681-1010(-)